MANKINFITGETYTLAELFSGERQIIIPDLQRDYCWGSSSNKKASGETGELVSDFIDNLFIQYGLKDKAALNLGLIYGYEVPADHIQLCDGQQRLTTLFLLLGMVNKYTGKFRQYLISDFEYKHDDKEPYLKYAIRESSLYFLSDLICQFFISNSNKVEDIKDADWYFADYSLDPSVKSMIEALEIIEKKLDGKSTEWLTDLGDWLVNKLTFLYFDMETRKNGEETFVIINTTGEPLSATQNLKPLVLKADINKEIEDAAEKWEEVETWFWQKRIVENGNDTADAGFAEFLRWITIVYMSNRGLDVGDILQGKRNCDFPYNDISVTEIGKYREAVEWVFSEFSVDKTFLSPKVNNDVNKRRAIGQNDCFVLLPVIKFVHRHLDELKVDAEMRRNARRIFEFFSNLIRIENVSKAVNSLVTGALEIVDRLDASGDILSLLNGDNHDISSQILRDEEVRKLEILRDASDREEIEELFWKVQKMHGGEMWAGEIMPSIKWAIVDGKFVIELYKNYMRVIGAIFAGKIEHEPIIELLRRCLIVCIRNYDPLTRGYYKTFGWRWNDWHCLLDRDSDGIRQFLDYIVHRRTDDSYFEIESILTDYIKENIDFEKDFSEFATDGYLLSFTSGSECSDMIYGADDWQICVKGKTTYHSSFLSRRNIYIMKEFGGNHENRCDKKLQLSGSEWSVWYYGNDYVTNFVVFENEKFGLKLDVRWAAIGNECVLEMKPVGDGSNFSRIVGLLPEFVPVENEQKAVFKKGMGQFDAGQIKEIIEGFMGRIDEMASVL